MKPSDSMSTSHSGEGERGAILVTRVTSRAEADGEHSPIQRQK